MCGCILIGCEHEREALRKPVKAWTGGSLPAPLATVSALERGLVTCLFRDQVFTYLNYWKLDRIETGILRTFWTRARADAHATYRS